MAAEYINPQWRLPNEKTGNNQGYSINISGTSKIESSYNIPSGTEKFSISFWINQPQGNPGAQGIISNSALNAWGNQGVVIEGRNLNGSTPQINARINWGGNSSNQISTGDLGVSYFDTWHHVVVTYDKSNTTGIIYYDGSVKTTKTNVPDFQPQTTGLVIGNYNQGAHQLNAKLFDVAIWENIVLQSGQVTQLYNSGNPFNPMALDNTPAVYYPLGNSAHMGSNYLTPNGALQDYVFDMDAGGGQSINSNINQSNTGGKFTVSIWAKNSAGLFTFDHGGSAVGQFRNFSNKPIVYLANNYFQYFQNQSTSNKWQHWVVFVDTANITNSKLWIDKVPISQGSSNTSGSANSFTSGLRLFQSSSGSTRGELSNMMYFTNYEIDQTNVDKLYNYGSPLMSTATLTQAPNAWYKLNASEIYDPSNTQWQIANNILSDKAYSFDGTNNIEITQNSSIQTSNFSIGFWIKGYPQSDKTIIENGGANGFSIKTDSANPGTIRILTGGANGLGITGGLNGEWNFVYFTMSGNTSRGGLNGGYNYAGGAARNYDSSKGLFIGSKSDSTSGFVGEIAQVVYYGERGPNNAGTLYGNLPANPPPNPLVGEANPSLVSWWKLDAASITDSNGSNNGTNNGATLIDTNVGRPAGIGGLSSAMNQSNLVTSDLLTTSSYSPYALNFDGNDYIDCGNTIYQVGTGDVTISAWANTSTTASGNVDIFGLGDNATTTSEIRLQRQASKFGAYINSTTASGQQLAGATTISDNVWYHVVLVKSSNVFTLYLNGVSDSNITWTGGALNGNGGVIGAYWGGGSNQFNGSISNISIWNTSLTSAQVREIYNEGLPSNLNSHSAYSNLVSWWQLGSNSSYTSPSWTVLDEIGSNNGTSTNMLENAIVDGVRTSGNGTSANMTFPTKISGSSPNGEGNSLSVNMTLANLAGGVN
jgi:hypothetical protein